MKHAVLWAGLLWSAPLLAQEATEDTSEATPESASEQQPAELPPITKLPELLEFVQAPYPDKATAEQIEASVVLELDIDIEGNIEGVNVAVPAEPAGYGFDEAAVEAAFQFRFSPAEAGGQPVPVRIQYRYNFALAVPVEVAPVPDAPAEPVVNLSGQLLERGTREPMVGTVVTVFRGAGDEAQGFEAVADEKGRFVFYDLPPGDWKILVEADGYYPYRTTETVRESERLNATYFVEKGSYNPFDVLVQATRPRKEVSRTTVSMKEIERIPGTFGDPLSVIQNLPGVARAAVGSGEIIVRGTTPQDTGIFIDGISVPLIYHFGGLRSVVPSGILESIDFYPGNYELKYGRQIGGIVDASLAKIDPERVGGYIDVSLLDAGVFFEIPVAEDFTLAVAGRRSYIDGILTAVIPEDSSVSFDTAPRYYDYQLLATYRPEPTHELTAFFFGSDDKLELVFDNPADFDVQLQATEAETATRFFRLSVKDRWQLTDKLENTFQISAGKNRLLFGLGNQFEFDLDFWLFQVREQARYKVSDAITVRVGADYLMQLVNGRINLPLPQKEGDAGFTTSDATNTRFTEFNDRQQHSLGVFVDAELQLLDGLLLIPGLRGDYFSRIDEFTVDPRLTTRYKLTDRWTLKGGVGVFHQEPFFDETDSVFGNPDIGFERAIHYSAGFEYQPRDYLTLDVTGFYNDLGRLVARSNAIVERNGEQVAEILNTQGQGRVYGAEILLRHKFHKRFFGWIAYTVSRAERLDPGQSDYRLFDSDQTHILTAVGSYQLPRNWEIGVRWRFVTGSPFSPIVDGIYQSDQDEFEPVFGNVNSARLASFHQLDVRVDKRWIYETWTLGVYLDIQNIYNRENPDGVDYNFDFSETQRMTGLPILTVLGLRAEF